MAVCLKAPYRRLLARNLLGMAITAGNSAGDLVSEVIKSTYRPIRGAIYVAFARGVML